jgi:hypothetical protein
MTGIAVTCSVVEGGWSCVVRVTDDGTSTEHRVGVSAADLGRLEPGAVDPVELVRRSFVFLLEREPKESILRSFELTIIGRYFPEWERRIRR